MPPASPFSTPRTRRIATVVVLTLLVLVADLSTKSWAWHVLRVEGRRRIIPGFLHFEFAFNTGSAFGILRNQAWARTAFIVVTAAALAYLGRLCFTLPARRALPFVAIGFIVGGALGNLYDRLFRTMLVFDEGTRHGVVDFIVFFYAPGERWPAFNLADVALLLGVASFLFYLQRGSSLRQDQARAPAGGAD